MGPLVSVLIPTCNRPELLLKAINSAFLQSYENIEIVVSDNSNTTESALAIARFTDRRLLYSRNKVNIGPILNWREALHHAKGDYCILLPDDDYFINPFYIEDAVSIALQYEVGLVITDCILAMPSKRIVCSSGISGLIEGKLFISQYMNTISIPTIANLFDRKKAIELDAFRTNDILYSDIELWMKIMSLGNAYCYNVPSVYYLFHGDNIVTNMASDALVRTSKYISPSVNTFASEDLIYQLVSRYVLFVDSIYRQVDLEFIREVFNENMVLHNPSALLLKCKYSRAKVAVKMFIKNFLRK